jgi:hypothetical protein
MRNQVNGSVRSFAPSDLSLMNANAMAQPILRIFRSEITHLLDQFILSSNAQSIKGENIKQGNCLLDHVEFGITSAKS